MGNYGSSEMKMNNLSKVRDSFDRRDLIVSGYPYRLRIEISNICNLKCTFSKEAYGTCPQWSIAKTPTVMSFDFFKKIIDEVGIYLTHSELYNYGEPFINPQATDMIRYLKSINPEVILEMHTNGHFFETDEKRADVIRSGLDTLLFSVDGITQEVYEKYRIGGDLNKVIDAIRGICDLKKEMNTDKPKVIFQFILFDHNFHEALDVDRFAKGLGVNEVALKTDIFRHKTELKVKYSHIYNSIIGLQSKDSIDNFYQKDKLAGTNFCDFPWTYPTVLADKQVVVCCRDGQYKSVVGSLKNKSLLEVWNGQGYQQFRRNFLEAETKPVPCCLCECRLK